MSEVLKFFQESPRQADPLHKALAQLPALKERVRAIQHEQLGCCGVSEAKNGKVELAVVDSEKWDTLAEERTRIMGRLAALDKLTDQLDEIFADAAKAGFEIHMKTPAGIRAVEVVWRRDHKHAGSVDNYGHPLPTQGEPTLMALADAAEQAMAEAGL